MQQGLEYMADQVRSGEVSHVIEGVGDPCTEAGRCAVGHYLSGFEGRVPDHLDLDTGAGIIIDRTGSSPVVVVLQFPRSSLAPSSAATQRTTA